MRLPQLLLLGIGICSTVSLVGLVSSTLAQDGSVLELEVEDALFEDAILRTTIPPTPTATPVPEKNRFLHENERKQFEESGVVIRSMPPFLSEPVAIGLEIQDQDLEFEDAFIPESTDTRSTDYSVTATQPFGYQVLVWQRTRLRNLSGTFIPDTRCAAEDGCTPYQAARWIEPEQYGLGYRVSGTNTIADFIGPERYRPFPSAVDQQIPAIIQFDSYAATTQTGSLELKLNLPPSFQQGTYTHDVVMIAMPTL